jgi:hypothetical protein
MPVHVSTSSLPIRVALSYKNVSYGNIVAEDLDI